ncbi:ribosome biogenesis protein Slx9p [Diutina catenulata]
MAGIKKKSGLRDKVAKRNVAAKISQYTSEAPGLAEPEHHNPMLKLAKTTKREKRQTKSAGFTKRMMNKASAGVAKKQREQRGELTAQMDDLLSSLPAETVTITRAVDQPFVRSKTTRRQPNVHKRTGFKAIMTEEHANFNNVLQNREFRQSPFEALRASIKHNLE